MSIYLFDFSLVFKLELRMPTKKPKVLITFDEHLLNRVDDFRFENRINTRSEAIRRLIDEGLKKYEKKPKE